MEVLHIDFVHARIEHGAQLLRQRALRVHLEPLKARFFGQRRQSVNRQHRHTRTQRQALGHGAGGAQTGERAGATAEGDGVELTQAQAGDIEQLHEGRDQGGGGQCCTG